MISLLCFLLQFICGGDSGGGDAEGKKNSDVKNTR